MYISTHMYISVQVYILCTTLSLIKGTHSSSIELSGESENGILCGECPEALRVTYTLVAIHLDLTVLR